MTDTDAELIAEAESQAAILEELFSSADEHGADHYEEGCVVCDSPKNAAALLRRIANRLAAAPAPPPPTEEEVKRVARIIRQHFSFSASYTESGDGSDHTARAILSGRG